MERRQLDDECLHVNDVGMTAFNSCQNAFGVCDEFILYNGQAVFTNEWDLASLAYSQETKGPYHTDLPTPDDIRRFLQLNRVELNRTIKSQNVILTPNQILTKELSQDMKRWEELIRENVFRLGGHRDHLPASLAHMLYCIVAEEQYNLAYFFVKRIECARATPTANLPYHMFLTRLFRYVKEHYPHLDNGIYNVFDRVMRPLALKKTKTPKSSSHQGDDDEDDGASRASTPYPTTYLNSLRPLNYQRYDIPTSSKQDDDLLFERQTVLLNQSQQIHEEVRGGFKSFRKALNAIGAHYLPHSSEYVAPPSIDIVRPWFETIGYGEAVPAKGTLKKSLLPLSKEATKCGSSKIPIDSKTGHSKKRKESSSAMDSNLSQLPVSTPMDTGMHKEDQQATGGPTSLGVTSEARANPQLSSGMLAFNLNERIYSASFIIHSESTSGNDALAASTAKADLGNSAPSNFGPQQ
ncbi:hypothetical protein Tco_0778377 [Tanacetum coccineum]